MFTNPAISPEAKQLVIWLVLIFLFTALASSGAVIISQYIGSKTNSSIPL